MTRKTIAAILPPIIGILLALIFLQIRQTVLEHLHPEIYDDAVLTFEPLFDIDILFPIYAIANLAAAIFQFFIGLRVWDIYKQGQKILTLSLWQLTIISCLLFGIGLGLFFWYSRAGIQDLLFKILAGTLAALFYWCGNFISLFFIEKMKYSNQ